MKLLDDLRKLGILRVGVAGGTYKSAKDMPNELIFDNVYDKEKDLVGGKGTEKVEGGGAGDGRKPAGKGSGLLFFILLVVSVVATFFFGFVDFPTSWFYLMLVVLIIFMLKLFDYSRGICSLKMIWIYFFVYIIVSMIILSVGTPKENLSVENLNTSVTQNTQESGTTDTGTQAQVIDESEWIDYVGVKSPIFTFRYPKSYQIEEYGTSTLVYVDKDKDYDYHVTFTELEGAIPTGGDCEVLAKGVVASRQNSEVRYSKSRDFFGNVGCEYGINLEQDGEMVYEIDYSFATADKTFYVTSYAKKLSDLDILSKIMQSFRLK